MSTDQKRTLEQLAAPSDAVLDDIAVKVKESTFARMRPRRRKSRIRLAGIVAGGVVLLGLGAAGGAIATTLISSQADAVAANVACLESRGWHPTVHDDGVSFTGPTEIVDAFEEDAKECNDLVGITPRELTSEELSTVYQSQLEVRVCLIRSGLDLPPAPPFEEFAEGRAAWSPYLDIDDAVFATRFDELEDTCPQASLW